MAKQVFPHDDMEACHDTLVPQQQSLASDEFESRMKRAKREEDVGARDTHSSAFDLVDDALHISSEDDFEIPVLP